MNRKGVLIGDIWGLIFIVICIFAVFLFFLVGTVGKEAKIKSTVNRDSQNIKADYLLVEFLRMPVECGGKSRIPVIDCWDSIALSTDPKEECTNRLQTPTKDFFREAGISQYQIQFIQENKILCHVTSRQAGDTVQISNFISDLKMPSQDPRKELRIHLELIP